MSNRELIFSANKKDFRIDYYRGSGRGGQKRNKTSSAVRITYLPDGHQESCEETRSQSQNFDKAWKKMIQYLLDTYVYVEKQKARYLAGTERIRTYHEVDDRVTDHRTGQQWSYKQTIGKGQIGDILDSVAKEMMGKARRKENVGW